MANPGSTVSAITRRKPPNAGKGRKRGVPNKVTADVRAAITMLLETTAPKLQNWLDRVAKESPDRALEIVVKLAEYHIPKLNRSEVTGAGGGALTVKIVKFGEESSGG